MDCDFFLGLFKMLDLDSIFFNLWNLIRIFTITIRNTANNADLHSVVIKIYANYFSSYLNDFVSLNMSYLLLT